MFTIASKMEVTIAHEGSVYIYSTTTAMTDVQLTKNGQAVTLDKPLHMFVGGDANRFEKECEMHFINMLELEVEEF